MIGFSGTQGYTCLFNSGSSRISFLSKLLQEKEGETDRRQVNTKTVNIPFQLSLKLSYTSFILSFISFVLMPVLNADLGAVFLPPQYFTLTIVGQKTEPRSAEETASLCC